MRNMPRQLKPAAVVIDRRFAGGITAALSLAVVLLAASIVSWLVYSVHYGSGLARLDESAAQWGAAHATDASTRTLRAITMLGATPIIAAVAAVTEAASLARRRFGPLAHLTIVCTGVSILNNGLKLLIHRRRPEFDRLTTAAGWSFPSGHSAAAAAGWAAIALVAFGRSSIRWRAAGAFAAILIAAVVGASRVLLGVHWLTDVIAGVTVGWSWFLVVTLLFGRSLLGSGQPDSRGTSESVEPEGRVPPQGDKP